MTFPRNTSPLLFGINVVVFIGSLLKIHRIKELHHGYWGIILILLSIPIHNLVALILGYALLIDDELQHFSQALGLVPIFHDYTPIHKLGAWVMSFNKSGWFWPIIIVIGLFLAAVIAASNGWGV